MAVECSTIYFCPFDRHDPSQTSLDGLKYNKHPLNLVIYRCSTTCSYLWGTFRSHNRIAQLLKIDVCTQINDSSADNDNVYAYLIDITKELCILSANNAITDEVATRFIAVNVDDKKLQVFKFRSSHDMSSALNKSL